MHALKVWGGGKAPLILNSGTKRRLVVSFTPRPLDPGYPLKQKAGLALEPGWNYLTTEIYL
jgi:hypothetical protein